MLWLLSFHCICWQVACMHACCPTNFHCLISCHCRFMWEPVCAAQSPSICTVCTRLRLHIFCCCSRCWFLLLLLTLLLFALYHLDSDQIVISDSSWFLTLASAYLISKSHFHSFWSAPNAHPHYCSVITSKRSYFVPFLHICLFVLKCSNNC